MRRLAVAVALAVAIALVPGMGARVARAATPPAKVVIIVGPVGALTADYIAWGRETAAEARRYTSNVIEIYSPKATWARVAPALQGANLVLYLGHGNGWPSRYRTTPWPQSMNGLGLNPTAGTDNTTVQYWGEYYLATGVRLAPNAVVILSRLCYASGNSEPGLPEGTPAVAEQRVDNFAAGWLQTGARAVIADGHQDPVDYVHALFTTTSTVDTIWSRSSHAKGHAYSVGSVRTPGAVLRMDPDLAQSGYYRSIAGWPAVSSTLVVRTAYPPSTAAPAALTVPGAAAVGPAAAGLFPDAALTPNPDGTPPATLVAGTVVRLTSSAPALADGTAVLGVATLDGLTTGYMRGPDLVPRDSVGPAAWWMQTGTSQLSPNGDGWGDTVTLFGRLSEPAAAWKLEVRDAGGTAVATLKGTGQDVKATWTGLAGSAALPEGGYTWDLSATDPLGNAGPDATGSLTIDLAAPTGALAAAPATAPATALPSTGAASTDPPLVITPNGDGAGDVASLPYTTSEPGYVDIRVANATGTTVRSRTFVTPSGAGTATWDGGNYLGAAVPDGTYTLTATPRDFAGNRGPAVTRSVIVYTTIASFTTSSSLFYPQDHDALAPSILTTFVLKRAATVTYVVTNAAGAVVLSRFVGRALAAGTYAFAWKGLDQTGATLPAGAYALRLSATDGTASMGLVRSVTADAFRITTSATTAAPATRGRTLTVTAVTAEPLTTALPVMWLVEPGITPWSVRMAKISATTYRATVTLRSGGPAGTLRFSVSAVDTARGRNTSVRSVILK